MTLNETWFLEGYIDFELQKYRLLAYLKEIKQHFREVKLYPYLADLVNHHNNLVTFRNNKKLLQSAFPKKLDGIEYKPPILIYEEVIQDDETMKELDNITDFAVSNIKDYITEGVEIYEYIESKLKIEPIGIIPNYKSEGYLFITEGEVRNINIYRYKIGIFERFNEKYRGVNLEFVDKKRISIVNTFEQLKLDLIREFRILPNPAVYKIEIPICLPFQESILPVSKRVFMKYIA